MSHQTTLASLSAQFDNLNAQVSNLTAQNSQLQKVVSDLQDENNKLRQSATAIKVLPVVSCLAMIAHLQVPSDIRTMGIMALTQLKANISRTYAELNTQHNQNMVAIAHNRRVLDSVVQLLNQLNVTSGSGEAFNPNSHRRWSAAEPEIVTKLKAAIVTDDDYDVAVATLKTLELQLVGAGRAVRQEASVPAVLLDLARKYRCAADAKSVIAALSSAPNAAEVPLAIAVEAFSKNSDNYLVKKALEQEIANYKTRKQSLTPTQRVVLHAFENAATLGLPVPRDFNAILDWANREIAADYRALRPYLING